MNSEVVKNWVQSVAIVLAGLWVLFEFVLADVSSGFRGELRVSAEIGQAFNIERSRQQLREMLMTVQLKNVGDQKGQVGIISVRVDGHAIADDPGMVPAVYPGETSNFLDFRDINWTQTREILAYALLNPSHTLLVDENLLNDTRFYVVDDGSYDIVSYSVKAQVVNPCTGVSIFKTCYDFRVKLTGDWSDQCENGYPIGGVCGWFERRSSHSEAYEKVDQSEMLSKFDWREIETGGLLRPSNTPGS